MSSKYLEAVKVSIDLIALKIECLEDVDDRKRATLEIEKFIASFQKGAGEKNLLEESHGMKKTPGLRDVDERKKLHQNLKDSLFLFKRARVKSIQCWRKAVEYSKCP